MQLSCDRTGFPIAYVKTLGMSFNLLPITKIQFEQFLAEPCRYGDFWYEKVLAVSPRSSWRSATAAQRAGLFMTGVLPREVSYFAQWLGEGFVLPTITEWRQIDHWACHTGYDSKVWRSAQISHVARHVLETLEQQLQPKMWSELMLLYHDQRDGIGNWVHWKEDGSGERCYGILGRIPRSVGNPQKHSPFLSPTPQYRDVRYGCRLVRA